MLIDWFTVVAQTLNFLVLVWLMQRFLYKPILRAIDAREKIVAQRLAEGDLKKAEAQKERDEFKNKNDEFERQRAAFLSQATQAAESERVRLLNEARKAADDLSAKRMETLRSEAHTLREAIGRRAQQEVFAIARKTLSDLAGASLEERMADVFIRQLRALSDREKEELKSAFTADSGTAVVRSAFDLPAAQRASLEDSVRDLIGGGPSLRFETLPDLVGGIDLTANGRKLSWNIAAYLQSLEAGIGEFLEVKGKPKESGPEQGTHEHGI